MQQRLDVSCTLVCQALVTNGLLYLMEVCVSSLTTELFRGVLYFGWLCWWSPLDQHLRWPPI